MNDIDKSVCVNGISNLVCPNICGENAHTRKRINSSYGIANDPINISDDDSDDKDDSSIKKNLIQLVNKNPDYDRIICYQTNKSTLSDIEIRKKGWKTFFEEIRKSFGRLNKVIGNVKGFDLRWSDLNSLSGINWLNDKIVNSFMSILEYKCRSQKIIIHVVDTLMYGIAEVRNSLVTYTISIRANVKIIKITLAQKTIL